MPVLARCAPTGAADAPARPTPATPPVPTPQAGGIDHFEQTQQARARSLCAGGCLPSSACCAPESAGIDFGNGRIFGSVRARFGPSSTAAGSSLRCLRRRETGKVGAPPTAAAPATRLEAALGEAGEKSAQVVGRRLRDASAFGAQMRDQVGKIVAIAAACSRGAALGRLHVEKQLDKDSSRCVSRAPSVARQRGGLRNRSDGIVTLISRACIARRWRARKSRHRQAAEQADEDEKSEQTSIVEFRQTAMASARRRYLSKHVI